MSYVKVETSVPRQQKFLAVGPAAAWLWLCGVAYCQDGLTDGFIPREAINSLGVPKPLPLVSRLVQARLWHEEADGWRIHKYLDHNNSAEHIRRVQSERRRAGRTGGRPEKQTVVNVLKQFAFGLFKQPVNPSVSVTVAVSDKEEKQVRANAQTPCAKPVETRSAMLAAVIRHRRHRSKETADGKPAERVIAALARDIVRQHPHETEAMELRESVKDACAKANLQYDGYVVDVAVQKALERQRKAS